MSEVADRKPNHERERLSDLLNKGAKGIECAKCGCRHFRVIYTRPRREGHVERRRECRNCGRRITTTERVAF